MIGDFVAIIGWVNFMALMWYGVLMGRFPLWLAMVICMVFTVIIGLSKYEYKGGDKK